MAAIRRSTYRWSGRARPLRPCAGLPSLRSAGSAGVDFSDEPREDRVVVPHHSEWFSVAWLRLPATNLDDAGPFYEDIFKVRWELAL